MYMYNEHHIIPSKQLTYIDNEDSTLRTIETRAITDCITALSQEIWIFGYMRISKGHNIGRV